MAGNPSSQESEPIPASAVAAPRPPRFQTIQPEHLYKTAGLLFLLAILFHYFPTLAGTFLLMYAAIILAVIFNALIQLVPGGRKWVTVVLGLLILTLTTVVLWFAVPQIVHQLRDLTSQLPALQELLDQVQSWILVNTGFEVDLQGPEANEAMRRALLSGGASVLARVQGVLGVLFVPLLLLFGALYAAGKPNEQLLTPLLRAVPRDRRPAFQRVAQLLGDRLLGWARGVLIGMVFVGILSYVFYTLIGVPNSLALAVIAGLTEAVPLLGPWIGGGIAVLAAFLTDPTRALWTAVAALAIQQIENQLLIPWAMSREAKVHPFVTLFALVFFGQLFGFLGVLLAIPLVLLITTFVEVLWVERAIDTDQDFIAPVVKE
jgi:predicted PurR-regulated permease PerM